MDEGAARPSSSVELCVALSITLIVKSIDSEGPDMMKLIETDPVEWTLEWLRYSIGEHEKVWAKLISPTADPELESLRRIVKTDLNRKRKLLAELRSRRD